MRPRSPAPRASAASAASAAVVGLAALFALGACSKAMKSSDSEPAPSPASTATMAPTPSASLALPEAPPSPPPVYAPGQSPPPTPTMVPTATAPAVVPPEEQGNAKPRPAAKSPPPMRTSTPSPKPAKPVDGDLDGRQATPAPSLGVKKVGVSANHHFTCSSTEKRDNVAAIAEPRGARISIIGQGPCPGEVHDWSAQVSERRVEVNGTHGTTSKCRCAGSGELVLRGLDPGTYDVAVNGGFDRPIATRIVVSQ